MSFSSAAGAVLGREANGRTGWRNEQGKALKHNQETGTKPGEETDEKAEGVRRLALATCSTGFKAGKVIDDESCRVILTITPLPHRSNQSF